MATLLPVVAAALIDRDGRVLLTKRPKNKPLAGLWEFPGGKIEDGETPETALIRELREELGIETEISCLAPVGFSTENTKKATDKANNLEEFHLLILLFACRKWGGLPLGLEGQEISWVRPLEILNYKMPPPDRPLAAQVRDLLCTTL